ncbi:MAG TPA: ParB/RepB/Spo0J family partition protein [Abditibacterium sp.]|jgi:ParB family chromosome partitioning protein
MPTKTMRRGLGRGLSALIPESDFDFLNIVARGEGAPAPIEETGLSTSEPTSASSAEDGVEIPRGEIRFLAIDSIEANPFQPRQTFLEEELENLAASIREHGVLQPILVRPLPGSPVGAAQFQLIAGERRWRAATRAGLSQVPAIVRAVDDKSALELAIIENVQRHDISSIESAQAYRRLAKEFGLSQEEIAGRVGKSRASVANTMRLLDLPEEALGALRENKMSEGHGRALLTASGESARRALLRRTLRDGLSVRELERLAREANSASETTAEASPRLARAASPDLARLETSLQRALGAKLKLKSRRRGGQIIIDFASPEELSRLVKRMTSAEIEAPIV